MRNASQCEEMYNRGQKLANDTHEVSPRRTSGGDLSKKGHQWWLPIIFVMVASSCITTRTERGGHRNILGLYRYILILRKKDCNA